MDIDRLPRRIAVKIKPDANGCWVWTACTTSGYGQIRWQGRMQYAHRVVYQLLIGPIPEESPGNLIDVDHLCRVRLCVNPDHLEVVSQRENLRRMHEHRKAPTLFDLASDGQGWSPSFSYGGADSA